MARLPYLCFVNSNVADLELADPSLDVRGCKGLDIADENMGLGDSDLLLIHTRPQVIWPIKEPI